MLNVKRLDIKKSCHLQLIHQTVMFFAKKQEFWKLKEVKRYFQLRRHLEFRNA